MSPLKSIRSGKQPVPPRLVLYGTEGIGKSTFGASAPNAIFVPTEDGLSEIDCQSFPVAKTYTQFRIRLSALLVESHDFRTVVIDSLDWLERLIWDELCTRYNVSSIEKVDGGYAKGYMHALTHWRDVLSILDDLRLQRGMAVVGIAHAKVEKFEDPEQAHAYDRYSPRLHKHACGLVTEWADAVLFASRRIIVQTEEAGFNKTRAVASTLGRNDGSERILKTVGGPACVAKNRYSLPAELPLSWPALVAAMYGSASSKEGV